MADLDFLHVLDQHFKPWLTIERAVMPPDEGVFFYSLHPEGLERTMFFVKLMPPLP